MLLKNSLKLVIWDLDDTFWKGTLTEGGIEPIEDNIVWLERLTNRGIINSICSKNLPDETQKKLDELGVAEYFVFNQIAFLPKGEMIRQQLEAMQLRPDNALFVDDRIANLEEASFINPGLMTLTPDLLADALNEPYAQGKPDNEKTRLHQYREMESRWQAMNNSGLDNQEFLRQSDIKVIIEKDWRKELDRIVEILERTNQLNFTKLRSTTDELTQQLTHRCSDAGLIRVIDKYADYGWVGFYALEGNQLLHFTFSCRIMNMGIETWLYERLGRPQLKVVEPVVTKIAEAGPTIDWIKVITAHDAVAKTTHDSYKGVVRASCNVDQIIPYLAGNIEFEKEFNYPSTTKGYDIQRQLMCWLPLSQQPLNPVIQAVLDRLPIYEPKATETALNKATDYIILSPVMDFLSGHYRHKTLGFVISLDNFDRDITQPGVEFQQEISGFTPEFLREFSAEFARLSPFPADWYLQQLDLLLDQWSPSAQLILLLPNDQYFGDEKYQQVGAHLQHCNEILHRWASQRDRVTEIGFAELVTSTADFTYDAPYLYTRKIYFSMAQKILAALNSFQKGQIVKISKVNFLISRIPYIQRSLMSFGKRVGRALARRWQRLLGKH